MTAYLSSFSILLKLWSRISKAKSKLLNYPLNYDWATPIFKRVNQCPPSMRIINDLSLNKHQAKKITKITKILNKTVVFLSKLLHILILSWYSFKSLEVVSISAQQFQQGSSILIVNVVLQLRWLQIGSCCLSGRVLVKSMHCSNPICLTKSLFRRKFWCRWCSAWGPCQICTSTHLQFPWSYRWRLLSLYFAK